MRTSVAVDSKTGYESRLIVNRIDEDMLGMAKKIFDNYKKDGVIVEGSFADDVWVLSNEIKKTKVSFCFSDVEYKRTAGKWIGCTGQVFKESLKAYEVFQLGRMGPPSLRVLPRSVIKAVMKEDPRDVWSEKTPYHLLELLRILPTNAEGLELLIESLEDRIFSTRFTKQGDQRKLVDFLSYMRFHEALTEFWDDADEEERLFYFPVYLWWKLTAVIPLRPKEFLIIPRECVTLDKERCWLTVRRSKIKGKGKIGYKIDRDHVRCDYPVSDEIASLIWWYRSRTEKMEQPDIDALFRIGSHRANGIIRELPQQGGHYSYSNLITCLEHFYSDIIPDRKDIAKIRLGDTRHIAMMNLIISGGSPVVCKELAGHSSISISSHYYSNFSTLVECRVYEEYRRAKKTKDFLAQGSSHYIMKPKSPEIKVPGGWCHSAEYAKKSINDCVYSISALGAIGECSSCRLFRPDIQGIRFDFFNKDSGKDRVDADGWFLRQMIEAYRKGIGHESDIQTAILKLQESCHHYARCLRNDHGKEDLHAKTQKAGI